MTDPATTLNRADIAKIAGNNPKIRAGLESAFAQILSTAATVGSQTDATTGLQNATAITLSPNDALVNERILQVDSATMSITDNGPGNTVVIALLYPITTQGGFRLQFDLAADTEVVVPSSGTLLNDDYLSDGPYATDAAAAAGGVALGAPYRKTGGSVVWRQV